MSSTRLNTNLKWSLGPKTGSVDGICQQTDSMNRFYLDVKTVPNLETFSSWDVSSYLGAVTRTEIFPHKNKKIKK